MISNLFETRQGCEEQPSVFIFKLLRELGISVLRARLSEIKLMESWYMGITGICHILTAKQFAQALDFWLSYYLSKLEPKGIQCSQDLRLDPDNRTEPRLIILLPRGIPSYSQRTEKEPISTIRDHRTICKRRRLEVEETVTHIWSNLMLEHQKKMQSICGKVSR